MGRAQRIAGLPFNPSRGNGPFLPYFLSYYLLPFFLLFFYDRFSLIYTPPPWREPYAISGRSARFESSETRLAKLFSRQTLETMKSTTSNKQQRKKKKKKKIL
jgi:hypothetical protein